MIIYLCLKVPYQAQQFETEHRKHQNTPVLAAPRRFDSHTCTPLVLLSTLLDGATCRGERGDGEVSKDERLREGLEATGAPLGDRLVHDRRSLVGALLVDLGPWLGFGVGLGLGFGFGLGLGFGLGSGSDQG